jgi:hypothetical protein
VAGTTERRPLIRRCFVCGAAFQGEQHLEHLPPAERVAYDPERGRLWLVCSGCRRWSLMPIEDRWEALEELERAVTDGGGKVLARTDRIALVRVGPLEIVRVGGANRAEEAWWRYGRELVSRRQSYGRLSMAAGLATAAVLAGGWATGGVSFIGAWWLWGHAPDQIKKGARWLRFGSDAWRGQAACPSCGHPFERLRFRDRTAVFLLPHTHTDVEVVVRCPRCGEVEGGGLHLEGRAGERALRRLLAHRHFSGASENRVRSATRLIEEAGSPSTLARLLVRDGRRLEDLQRTGAVALEIAANESAEQRLLEMEVAELEAVWRLEEELAAIVDGELTPLPPLEALRRRLTGQ